jgi:hypothetical protein
MFGEQPLLLPFVRHGAAHLADQMHDRVAMRDTGVELVQRIAAEVLEVFLHLHSDVLPREVMNEVIAVRAKLVGDRRKKDYDRHGGRRSLSVAILPHRRDAEYSRFRPLDWPVVCQCRIILPHSRARFAACLEPGN